ncbi:LOW QUALITY PROTEIN: uncharacterized protein LOC108599061 [Drosophila busckii]|uniref:LOW QUALITY PROTEIN: uncharacterized protein LOC108599061 n=1 Tax=Drosophila busckii TaxID=30019 RepID=UPI001432C936|nr:LOW QUALITY PROTEIN: uncharacterized protein LOC108599061 [Drosophila busckii]
MESPFKNCLCALRKTASLVNGIEMDMPLSFEVFLPIRLPIALKRSFNKKQRTVQMSKCDYRHPFFFGNSLSAKYMNIRLKNDLRKAVAQLAPLAGYWGTIYDIEYEPLKYNRVPFAHQLYAKDRYDGERSIRFDFILAVEFNGAEAPLPAYYNAPQSYKWWAYGLVAVDNSYNPVHWGVLLPCWQNATIAVLLRCHNMLLLLHRLLYAQRCHCLKCPMLLKLSFFMTALDKGEQFKSMSVAELIINSLGHQVFRNFCELLVLSTVGDYKKNAIRSRALRQQQVRGKGIFAMLAKGQQLNVISSQFIMEYFQLAKHPVMIEVMKGIAEETTSMQHIPPLVEATSRRKRRRSI